MKPTKVTQGQRWHRFFTLLNTTNYHDGIKDRKVLAKDGNKRALTETYIESRDDKTHSWVTRRMPFGRLVDAALQGCTVGHKGTTLEDAVKAIWVIAHSLKINKLLHCELRKNETSAYLILIDISNKQKALLAALRDDEKLKESESVVEPIGVDAISIEWWIPLRRES